MPSTIDVRSFGSMRIQSCSNQRLTASNWSNRRRSNGAAVLPTVSTTVRDRAGRPSVCCELGAAARVEHPSRSSCRAPTAAGGAPARARCRAASTRRATPLSRQLPLPLRELLGDAVRVDGGLVHVEQRHVVVDDLVQQDHELHEVRVRLLPERLLAPAEEVVQERGDAVGQRIGVEVVVQRVVAVRRVEADLDVVVGAPVLRAATRGAWWQKSPFTSRTRPPMRSRGILRAVAEQLLGVRDTCSRWSCRCRWRRRWRCR